MIRRAWRGDTGIVGMAGWLFAELAMVFAIVALSSEVTATPVTQGEAGTAASAAAPPSTLVSPARTPVVTSHAPAPSRPPAPPRPIGLSVTWKQFVMPVPAHAASIRRVFVKRLGATVGTHARVGLIQLFGRARDVADELGGGIALSTKVAVAVQRPRIGQLMPGALVRPFFGGTGMRPGYVRVEVFVVVQVR